MDVPFVTTSSRRLIPQASLLCVVASLYLWMAATDAVAQERKANEQQWTDAIKSDIRNGASPATICMNSITPAEISDDPVFKDWAYGIARRYCKKGTLGKGEETETRGKGAGRSKISGDNQKSCSLTSIQITQISKGRRVGTASGDCRMVFNAIW